MRIRMVPPCPRCGSPKTGQYVDIGFGNPEREIAYCRRKGELIRDWKGYRERNFFCEDCGVEWAGVTQKVKITKEELAELKKAKGIEDHEKLPSGKKKKKSKISHWLGVIGGAMCGAILKAIVGPIKKRPYKPETDEEEEDIWNGYNDVARLDELAEED